MQLGLGQVKTLLSLVNGDDNGSNNSNGGGLGALGSLLGNQSGQSSPSATGGGLGALGSLLGGGNAEGGIKNAILSSVLTKIAQKFKSNPSDECLKECTDELNGVLSKFSNVLGDDFNLLSKLLR